MTLDEFRCWLEGFSFSFDLVAPVPSPEDPDPVPAFGPSPAQWAIIVKKLDTVRLAPAPPPLPIPGVGVYRGPYAQQGAMTPPPLVNPMAAGTRYAGPSPRDQALTNDASLPADAATTHTAG